MAGIYGADVAQLRALGKALASSSARLASTRTALSRDVRDPGRWKGADAERFRNEWDGTHSLLLGKVVEALAEAGKRPDGTRMSRNSPAAPVARQA